MRRFRFSPFEIDLDLFTLTKNTVPVVIGHRTMDQLICLVENRDHVVSSEFLRSEVWKSAALSPAAIPTCVLELRRVLGDDRAAPKYVETVRARGYRFIAEIGYSPESRRIGSAVAEEFAFSGRRQEMATLLACVRTSIAQARGHMILIRGEAGIGKSRLLDEFLLSIAPKINCFAARSSNIEGTPPFWPWIHILRGALETHGKSNRPLMENAQALSTVFPEIKGSVTPTSAPISSIDRFSILSQWARTIRSLANGKALLLAFEDAHRADVDSLSLMHRLAEELANDPILLIATHRPPPSGTEAAERISDISSVRHAVSIELTPLSTDEIKAMLDPLSGNRDTVAKALKDRTSGNAFYVTHLIRYLSSIADQKTIESRIKDLPMNAGEIVSRQLSDLPPLTRSILSTAAIIGERFSIQSLSRVLDRLPADLIRQLEPAVDAWLIQEEFTEYSFTHAILRDALYQTIDSPQRRRTHLQLARELGQRSDAYAKSGQISDHLANAMPLAPHDEARRFAVLAGREAASRFAFSRAQDLFRRAYNIALDDPESNLAERCEIMQELAKSMLYDGNRAGAREMLFEVSRLARQLGSPQILSACALELVPDFLSIEVGLCDSALVSLLEESLAAVPNDELSLRAQLLARLAQAQQWAATSDRSEALAIESLRLARASGDQDALVAALSARADCLHGPERVKSRIQHVVMLGECALGTGKIPTVLLQKTRMIAGLLELGDIRSLKFENEAYRQVADEIGLAQYRWYPGATDTMLAMMRGDLDRAELLADAYKKTAGRHADQNFTQTYACQYVVRQIERNRSAQMISMVHDFAEQHKAVFSWAAAHTWLQWDAGLEKSALESLQRFTKDDIVAMSREAGGGIGIATLSEVAASIGDVEITKFLFQIVSRITDRCASAGYGVAYFGSYARYAGLLAQSLGDSAAAIAYFQHAVEQESLRGARSWRAMAYLDLLLLQHHQGISDPAHNKILHTLEQELKDLKLTRVHQKLAAVRKIMS